MTEATSDSPVTPVSLFRNLGRALFLLRELRGKSQRDLAREIGSGAGQLSKYETGKGLPALPVFEKILLALDLDPLAFFYVMATLERCQMAVETETTLSKSEREVRLSGRLIGGSAGAALQQTLDGVLALQAELVALTLGFSRQAAGGGGITAHPNEQPKGEGKEAP